MKKRVIFVIFLLFVAAGCAMTSYIVHALKTRGIEMNAVFHLTPKQIARYTRLAETGDADAAYKLYEYYEYYLFDQASALSWLNKSADLGNEHAKEDILKSSSENTAKHHLGQVPK